MMSKEPERYHKSGMSAQLGAPIKITRSQNHRPGGILTLGTDYKTRAWSAFRIDNIDASPSPYLTTTGDIKNSSRPEAPKYHDLVIPIEVSVKEGELNKKHSCRMPIKVVDEIQQEKYTLPLDNRLMDNQSQTSSSHSVQSHSIASNSTKSIFGRRNPVESYSFKGTKLCKSKVSSSSRSPHYQQRTFGVEVDVFSLHSFESKSSQQTRADLANKSSQDLSDIKAEWPAHQIHSRMMGWKLTSPERRRELLRILENANLSTDSMTENDIRTRQRDVANERMNKMELIAKRQSEAYKRNVSRIALHQNKEFKFSKNQLDIMKAKVTKLMKDEAAVEKVIRPCGRKLHAFKAESDDPFANVEVKRILTAEVAKEVEKRLYDRRGCPNESGRNNLQQEDSFTALRCVHTPKFQTVERDHRALLNPADRMELLANASDVEKTVAVSHKKIIDLEGKTESGDHRCENMFIGSCSPKRGLSGEAYLASLQSTKGISLKKPVQLHTGYQHC